MSATFNNKTKTARQNVPLRDLLPTSSGDYGADVKAGERCARALLTEIRATNSRCLLGMMVLEMAKLGYPDNAKGVVIGFMAAVASEIPLHPWEALLREQQGVASRA